MVTFGVLGPLVAEDGHGPLGLRGPRHRAVLARLLIARRRVVPVRSLVADLWDDPPEGAVGAIQTFVGALRQAIEPDRSPRAPARLLVTEAPGYALRAEPDAVDAWRFEAALAESATLLAAGRADAALSSLDNALALWRGPAYSEFADEHWARTEITRLDELRLLAVERRAQAGLELGRAADVVADLRAHVDEHPWREHGWFLLALALYRSGRQGDALAALRTAKAVLVAELGLDPGPELRKLEADMLAQAPATAKVIHERSGGNPFFVRELAQLFDAEGESVLAAAAAVLAERRFAPHQAARLWQAALAAHDGDPRTRLDLIMGLVRALAVTGELETARQHRAAVLAEDLGDPVLTAQVIGAFDVPGIWTANDDPALAEQIVAITERTLAALPPDMPAQRGRLLSTVAMELRGTRSTRGREAAIEAEAIARRLGDPSLLAFALNGRFMHTFERAGLAPRRAAIGRELVSLATRHELVAFEVLGHLILMQAHSALAEFGTADEHAAAADRLGDQHEIPLVGVFTDWYSALRLAVRGSRPEAEAKYRAAAARLSATGMRGMRPGILPLALLSLRPDLTVDLTQDWGPYLPWVRPLGLLSAGDRAGAVAALKDIPESPRDLLYEARLCLMAAAATRLGQEPVMRRAHRELLPAAGELAGAGSGLLSFGPVSRFLET